MRSSSRFVARFSLLAVVIVASAGCDDVLQAEHEARFERAVAQCRALGREPIIGTYYGNNLIVTGCERTSK